MEKLKDKEYVFRQAFTVFGSVGLEIMEKNPAYYDQFVTSIKSGAKKLLLAAALSPQFEQKSVEAALKELAGSTPHDIQHVAVVRALSGGKRAMPAYIKSDFKQVTFNPNPALVDIIEESYVQALSEIGSQIMPGLWEHIRPTLDTYSRNSKELNDVENEKIARAHIAECVADSRFKLHLPDNYKISPHFIHIVDVMRSTAAKYPTIAIPENARQHEKLEAFKPVTEEIIKTLMDEYFTAMRVPKKTF